PRRRKDATEEKNGGNGAGTPPNPGTSIRCGSLRFRLGADAEIRAVRRGAGKTGGANDHLQLRQLVSRNRQVADRLAGDAELLVSLLHRLSFRAVSAARV